MNTAPFSIKDALRFGFNAFKNNIGLLIGVSCLGLASNLGSQILTNSITCQFIGSKVAVVQSSDQAPQTRSIIDIQTNTDFGSPLLGLFLLVCTWLLGAIINLLILMGWNQIGLDIYNTGTSSFARLWVPRPKAITFFITAFLYSAICMTGTLLLIIPGIIWAIKYAFADLIVIDSDKGALESLKTSGFLTNGYKWYLLQFFFAALIITFLSVVTIIGPFILVYVMFLARVYIYKKLQEQWQTHHVPPTPFMP